MMKEEMKTAIVVFAYNRAEAFTQMIQSLSKCDGIKCLDLWIFSDGPRNETDLIKVDNVRRAIDSIDRNCFRNVFVEKSTDNKGLANSIIDGISKVFSSYDSVICLEDDLIVRQDFVNFMVDALTVFYDDKRAWSISGFTPYLCSLLDFSGDLFWGRRASSWGWATWKNRWEMVDWDVDDYRYFKKNSELRRKSQSMGKDFPYLLDYQMNGIIDSWAVRWCYSQWKNNMLTVFPTKTRVINTGFGKDATHSKKNNVIQQDLLQEKSVIDFSSIIFDERIMEEYKRNLYINPIKAKIKILISKIAKGKKNEST